LGREVLIGFAVFTNFGTGVCLGREVLTGFAVFSNIGTGVCLEPAVILGVDFTVLPFERVVTTTLG
jgi:hypothetical protein